MHRTTPSGSSEAEPAKGSATGSEHELLDDQTVSDYDQAASDADQVASDGDQAQADADQRSSDHDQAAADRDRAAASPRPTDGVYEASRAARLEGTIDRAETARARAQKSADRLRLASSRDENARRRDLTAQARDRAAEQRDAAAASLNAAWLVSRQTRHGRSRRACLCVPLTTGRLHQARERFQQIRAQIKHTQPAASISVGFAPLHPEDTLEQPTQRGDRALYTVKHAR